MPEPSSPNSLICRNSSAVGWCGAQGPPAGRDRCRRCCGGGPCAVPLAGLPDRGSPRPPAGTTAGAHRTRVLALCCRGCRRLGACGAGGDGARAVARARDADLGRPRLGQLVARLAGMQLPAFVLLEAIERLAWGQRTLTLPCRVPSWWAWACSSWLRPVASGRRSGGPRRRGMGDLGGSAGQWRPRTTAPATAWSWSGVADEQGRCPGSALSPVAAYPRCTKTSGHAPGGRRISLSLFMDKQDEDAR
jgi:hypothetical protein